MERLTRRDEFGNADIIGVDSEDLQCNLGFEEFNRVTNALNKLAEYEDLEQERKLMKLPCTIRDVIYRINGGAKEPIIPEQVIGIAIKNDNNLVVQTRNISDYGENIYPEKRIGRAVFTTKELAEAALKEMEENFCPDGKEDGVQQGKISKERPSGNETPIWQ